MKVLIDLDVAELALDFMRGKRNDRENEGWPEANKMLDEAIDHLRTQIEIAYLTEEEE